MENTKHLILKDFEGRQIMKSYQNDEIFKAKKGPHQKHKYLRIENGRYIYDEAKMSTKDHKEAADYHFNKFEEARKKPHKKSDTFYDKEKQLHHEEWYKHKKLAEEKEKSKESVKIDDDYNDSKTKDIKKSEAFDLLIPSNFEDQLEKSKDDYTEWDAEKHKNEMQKHQEKAYKYKEKGNKDKAYEHEQLALQHKGLMRDKLK